LDQQKLQLVETSAESLPDEAEQLDDLRKLTQIDEVYLDNNSEATVTDFEQLVKEAGESWNTAEVRGRVVYFPSLSPRQRSRRKRRFAATSAGCSMKCLKAVRSSPVDLILNGLEYLRTGDTGHADSNLNWIVCGGRF